MSIFRYLRIIIIYSTVILLLLEAVFYLADLPKDYQPHSSSALQFQSTAGMKSSYTNRRSESIDFTYDGNPRGYFKDHNTVQHVTNAAGFRGPEILQAKPKNTYRVLFLGDSVTFGEGVYFEDTYPEQFKALAQKKDLFHKAIEPINAGVGGYNTRDEYTLLQDIIGFYKMNPDRIVVGYYLNDADKSLFRVGSNGQFTRVPSELESFAVSTKRTLAFFKFFRTFRILHNWYIGKIVTERTIEYYHAAYKDDNPSWLETKKAISDFGSFQKITGIPVTFIIFPALFQLDHYPFTAEQDKIIKELVDNNLDYIPLLPVLSGYKGPELWVHPTDQHPNEIVHRLAAEALVDKLSKP